MCGIAGSISQHRDHQPRFVESMLQKMLHRGPDHGAIATHGHVILGHRRLAIRDLSSNGNQPMWDKQQRFCLVLNGEIYNYAILKHELQQLGHTFYTTSDTEVLLQAWLAWGAECLQKCVGMYAFAIWDNQTQTLFIARDRMGEKPLFYTGFHGNLREGLLFASELKALTVHPALQKNISLPAISEFLSQNYLLTNTCIFKDVYKLPPAHYLIYRLGELPKIKCYWQLETYYQNKFQNLSFADAKQELLHLLKKSVGQEAEADVAVGAFLSGGIDSSSVAAQMAQQKRDVKTFSIGFKEKSFNELPASEKVAKHLQVTHQTKMVQPQLHDLLPKLAYQFDEPFADTSMIPTYLLAQFARQYVTVSLSGDGGDELFGGYTTYQANRWHAYLQKIPKIGLQGLRHLVQTTMRASFNKVSFDYKLKQFLQGCELPFQQAHTSWRSIFSAHEKLSLFHPEYADMAAIDPFTKIAPFFQQVAGCDPLDQAMYVDMKTWLADDILVKVDRASMAHSLEVRSPFLDHTIVEFAARLPVEYKIRGRCGKYILKDSQASLLPKTTRSRAKAGFNSPMALWLNNELFDMAYSYTTSSCLLQWLQKPMIEELWRQHRSRRQDNSYRLFGLLNLALWLEAYKE